MSYRLAIDGQALAGNRPTGLGQVARQVVRALADCPGLELLPVMPPDPAGFATARQRLLWEQIYLPSAVETLHPDLLYSPAFGAPLFGHWPKLLMVHDLLPRTTAYETGGSVGARWYWSSYLPQTTLIATAIITNSEVTRQALCAAVPIDPARVFPLALGAPWEAGSPLDPTDQVAWETSSPTPEPYVLCVGSLVTRKRQATLIRALAILREAHGHRLEGIFIGAGEPYGAQLRSLASELGIADQCHFPGYVEDHGLMQAVYAAALTVVLPSEAEGFDLPGIEACCAGTPVIASDLEVHHEVLGRAALYFPIADAAALAQHLATLVQSPSYREDRAAIALARGARYSWRTHADGVATIARALIEHAPLPTPRALALGHYG